MRLPEGRLLRQRVVADPATPLATALRRELTGYARLESQDKLLLDGEGVGVLTFEAGVPVVAYHTGTDAAGPPALADMAVAGPYRLRLYELDSEALADVHDATELTVPPAAPAERLAGDPDLAARTREAAPPGRREPREADEPGAVEAFLDDAERIETIRERAREEAKQRAAEWDL